jgi:hypothetical protein
MNEFEKLCRSIEDFAPDARIAIDAPSSPTGSWWGDVTWRERRAIIEWRPGRGFGVSAADGGYGEGPDVLAASRDEALARVLKLLGAVAA